MKNKHVLLLLTILLLGFSVTPQTAMAAEPKTISDSLFGEKQPKLKDGSKAHYNLDVTTNVEEDSDQNAAEEAISNAKDFITGKSLKEGAQETFYEMENFFANTMFQFNVFMTTGLLALLDIAFNYEVINSLIDQLDGAMVAVTGISSSGFSSGGLIGSFVTIASILSAVVALFLFLWKRSMMGALKSLGSTVLVLTLCLVFFTQYGTFLKGMNQVATETSQIILTGPSKLVTADNLTSEQIRKNMYKNMWDQFVHRPYLFAQYGTDDEKKIGGKRVETLLKMKPGKKRQEFVETKEVKDKKNVNMTYANVPQRLIFSGYYLTINTINGFVLIGLALLMVGIQFWFIAIACVAPFAFLWAMFPNQAGILKNYSFALAEPLGWKILISFFTFVFFTISTLAYTLNASNVGGYFTTSIAQTGIYLMLLLFRKKIKKIFRSSKEYRYIMSQVKDFKHVTTKSMETLAQGTATAIGATVGGPQGAAMGYKAVEAVKDRSSANNAEEVTTKNQPPLTSIKEEPNEPLRPEIVDFRDKVNADLDKIGQKAVASLVEETPKKESSTPEQPKKPRSMPELKSLKEFSFEQEEKKDEKVGGEKA